jgi:hypothetical protein
MGSDNDGKRHGKPNGALLCRIFVALLGIALLVWATVRCEPHDAYRRALTRIGALRSPTLGWWPRSRRLRLWCGGPRRAER